MQRFIVVLGLFLTFFTMSCTSTATPKETNKSMEKELRHVVLFKFKDGVSADSLRGMEMAFKGLASQIKEVKKLEFGLNNSPENLNQGFTHCFTVTFNSEADRAIYLPHPAHKAFVDNHLKAILDKVCVVDYWAESVK
jgi:Stress responsive A/B Barrel Domain